MLLHNPTVYLYIHTYDSVRLVVVRRADVVLVDDVKQYSGFQLSAISGYRNTP